CMAHRKWARWSWKGKIGAGRGEPRDRTEEIQQALVTRGLPELLAGMLADRASLQAAELEKTAREAYFDGIALAFSLQESAGAALARNLQGLREVERIMGAFSGELGKLDEVVGVLNTYVHRLKSSSQEEDARTLH
ncbi:hypothetical protein MK280_13495, partial [Myxococcota bacterium]|nr:hypothetical protein [Myxococcota bacterium]